MELNETIKVRVEKLRDYMKTEGLAAFIIPT